MTGVLVPTASETEWLAARLKGVTASEIAIIMGLSPYSSPYKLYHQKLGILPADDDSDVMEKGRVLEPVIAGKFAALHPELAVLGDGRSLWRHGEREWQLATPDRMLSEVVETDRCTCGADLQMHYGHEPHCGLELGGTSAVLECKVDGGSPDWGEEGSDEIPVHYRAQVLWQCRVMGVRRWHAGCFNADRWKARWYAGTIDAAAEADLLLMEGEALSFLERLERQDAPDVDWRPATISALKTMHPDVLDVDVEVRRSLRIQYEAAVRRAAEAKQRKDLMTARMLQAIGDGKRAIDPRDGSTIATRSVSHPKRIDSAMLRSRHPAIATECTKPPKPEIKLLPAKPPKDKNVSPDSK